jgi:hypothetical protein
VYATYLGGPWKASRAPARGPAGSASAALAGPTPVANNRSH